MKTSSFHRCRRCGRFLSSEVLVCHKDKTTEYWICVTCFMEDYRDFKEGISCVEESSFGVE